MIPMHPMDRLRAPHLISDRPSVPWSALGRNGFLRMPISLATRRQRMGLGLWVGGTAACFASWVAVLAWPDSAWSRSAIGFLAPAYLAYPWLVGIGMMSDRLHVRSPCRWWQYIVLSTAFVLFHAAHFVTIWPGQGRGRRRVDSACD